ncbi:glycosyltransferase [Gordonia sp. NPDC003429]
MMAQDEIHELWPVISSDEPPENDGAKWVGEIQSSFTFADTVKLHGGDGYVRARLLVREGTHVCGFVEAGVEDSALFGRELTREMRRLPDRDVDPLPDYDTGVSVVVCTRDRTDALRRVLDSILAMDYPTFEVIVVDNAASNLDTWRYIDTHPDARVNIVQAAVPGLAHARNCGLEAASFPVVAYTDDDVVVDKDWLRCLVRPFADEDVACVTGLVPPAELRTETQFTFEHRVGWAASIDRRTFLMKERHTHHRLFPFKVADYGTGANFAIRRNIGYELGGFDEGLGAGSPAKGGEDIDWFVRTIVAGHALVYEPEAIVWHQHRTDSAALTSQALGYGVGLGAWIAKVATDRHLAPLAAGRMVAAATHLVSSLYQRSGGRDLSGKEVTAAARAEIAGLFAGPRALFDARSQGRPRKPLKSVSPNERSGIHEGLTPR